MSSGRSRPERQRTASSFLDRLTAAERSGLLAVAARRKYRNGAVLFLEGDRSEHVVIISEGRVKVTYTTREGREVLLALREPGDILGELSAIDSEPRSANAIAIEAVEAVLVSPDAFRQYLEDHPHVSVLLLEMLSRRLRDADRKRIEFGAYDSIGRVASRLVELADRFGEPVGSGIKVSVGLSQEDLASWTGSSRESVAKALASLRAREWIATGRREIVIRNLEALRNRAG